MKKLSYWIIIYALVFATILAIILRLTASMLTEDSMLLTVIDYIIEGCSFVGTLFINALKMIIVPLIITSVTSSIASLRKVDDFGRLGSKTVLFYSVTTIIAALIGLLCVNIVAPGLQDGVSNEGIKDVLFNASPVTEVRSIDEIQEAKAYSVKSSSEIIKTLFRQMLPINVINAASDNGQVLGLITFSIIFGLALSRIPNRDSALLTRLIISLHEAVILITTNIMKVAPVGVFALIMSVVYNSGGDIFLKLGKYFFTVVLALLIHAAVVMPLILYMFSGINPLTHVVAMKTSLITAFSTASSAATIPATLDAVQEKAGVSAKIANFTIPLGSTVNMNGTALYECISVIFIAQVMGVDLTVTAQLGIVVAALLASVGVAGIPSASLVAIMLILKSTNIPSSEAVFAALLAVDRPLDMLRTAVNVFGDSCSAVVIAKSEGESIYPVEEEETFTLS